MSNTNNRSGNANANANVATNVSQQATIAPKMTPPAQAQAPRGPKFVWVVRPSFSIGSCRAYFSEEAAIKDFGQPKSKWYPVAGVSQISVGPSWDPDNATWELEKIEVR